MKEKLAALIAANKAKWVPALAAFITGGITQLATSKGLELPGDIAVAISTTTAFAIGWLFERALARLNRQGVRQIQDALPGIETTGQANPNTVAMVERLADRVKAPAESPPHALTIAEGAEIKRLLHQICRDRPELLAELRAYLAAASQPPPRPIP